jgi:mannose-6-phosphate isomerase-like protein (cupin superfamily)
MPLLRGKETESKHVNITYCTQDFYQIEDTNDLQLFCRVHKKAETDAENEWQAHSHPDIEEYTFVVKGQCRAILGNGEEYDLEEGDLLITPRGVWHKFKGGDATLLFFHAKHNVYGKTVQNKHPFRAYDSPSRKDPQEQADLPDVGVYLEMDALEREISKPDTV